jgi:hypothetical protein
VRQWDATGVSLVGLLVIVLVLGGLAAAAIVGVNSFTDGDDLTLGSTIPSTGRTTGDGRGNGGPGAIPDAAAVSACRASVDAATAASAAYFATGEHGRYPMTWTDLTASRTLALPDRVVVNPRNPEELDGVGWKLRMAGGGTEAPTFACSYPRP